MTRYLPLAFLLLAGCTTDAPLHYAGTLQFAPTPATVSAVSVTDARGESDPTWYGAIRGGFGNPLKVLHADRPIAATVQDALTAALSARGIGVDPATKAPSVSVTVVEFKSDKVMRSEAEVSLRVTVIDAAGRQIYERETSKDVVTSPSLDTGILADPKDLQLLAQATMNRAIDEALDAPAFRAAILTK